MTPALDIIIVNYNTADDLDACLVSLGAAPPAALRRITVIDNASTDDSASRVAVRWPGVELIRLDRNVGFGAANNVALRRAGAPLVLLLNSDTIAPPGAIDALVARLLVTGAVDGRRSPSGGCCRPRRNWCSRCAAGWPGPMPAGRAGTSTAWCPPSAMSTGSAARAC